jgi:trehalose-6-phosphate synthase
MGASSRSSVTDCLLDAPPSGVQHILSNHGSDYESEWENQDGEYFTANEREDNSEQQSQDYFPVKEGGILIWRVHKKQKVWRKFFIPVLSPVLHPQLGRQEVVQNNCQLHVFLRYAYGTKRFSIMHTKILNLSLL